MGELQFVAFNRDHIALYEQWFEDAETKRWLGTPTPEWYKPMLSNDGMVTWMIYDSGVPVAELEVVPLENTSTIAQVTYLVAPQHRRKGYGRRMLLALLERTDLKHITEYFAWVEPENTASRALLSSIGYEAQSNEPDEYGHLRYVYMPLRTLESSSDRS